jgi:hypothetical protein
LKDARAGKYSALAAELRSNCPSDIALGFAASVLESVGGEVKRGKGAPRKLTESDELALCRIYIWELASSGKCRARKKVAAVFALSPPTVAAIVKRRRWW